MATPFAGWLADQLARRGWSQAEFARRAELHPATVSTWVRGTRHPDPPAVDVIADVLGLDVDHVLAIAGHRPAAEDLSDLTVQLIERIKGARLSDRRIKELEKFVDLFEEWDREEAR